MTKLNNISKFSLVSTVDVEANLQNIVYQPRERYGTFFFVALFAEVEMSAHAVRKKRKEGRTKEGDLLFSPPPLLAGRRFGESQCAASKGIHANAILKCTVIPAEYSPPSSQPSFKLDVALAAFCNIISVGPSLTPKYCELNLFGYFCLGIMKSN